MIAAFFAGALVVFVIAFVFFGTVTKAQAERIRSLQAIIFGLEQHIIHLDEGNDDRMWMMRSNGVDSEVVRGRPDLPMQVRAQLEALGRPVEPESGSDGGSEAAAGDVVDLTYVFGEDVWPNE